ncbi:MAG: YcxB family protein [Virgibacillus proomii]
MIAKFNITDKDLIAQQKNAIKTTKFHRKARIMVIVIYLLLSMFVLVIADLITMFGFILSLILSPILWKWYEVANIKRFKDILEHNKNKLGVFTLNLSEEGFIKESRNLTEKIQWDDLKQLKEDGERYFLYLTDLQAITIKKEPENMNAEEVKTYQEFIKRKVIN